MAEAVKKKRPTLKYILIAIWLFFIIGFITIPTYIYSVRVDLWGLFGGMPSLKALENPKSDLSSELYSADGVLLGKYFRKNRTSIEFNELSPYLVNTLIATEDIRFQKHSGIDMRAMFRVGIRSLILGKDAGGGSTISQQLAKNLFDTRDNEFDGKLGRQSRLFKKVIYKTKEWLLSVILEKNYTKREIMAMYLNTVSFGSNAFGIKVAARTFFDVGQDSLNYEQSAMLVGLLKAPTKYSPVLNPEASKGRRNVSLAQLRNYKFISPEVCDSLQNLPIALKYKVENHNQGLAPYFRKVVGNYLRNWCREHGYDLYEDGLRIYTTVDSRMQQYAEAGMNQHMKMLQRIFIDHLKGKDPWIDEKGKVLKDFIEIVSKRTDRYRSLVRAYGEGNDTIDMVMNKKIPMRLFSWTGEIDTIMSPLDSIKYYQHFLQAGFMAMNPHNGHIKAWVGGIDHKYFKYDHVKQGKRQPGSTFKPIVYACAIENGYSPCYEVIDAPVTFELPGQIPPSWTPPNAVGSYTGEKMTIRQAMARSVNSITAYIMKKVGPQTVVKMARRLGIDSNIEAVPSLCLGAGGEISLFEMLGAYSTFVNKGVYIKPFYISRIEDKNGAVIHQFVPKTVEAINEETAYLMLHMLRGATEERGGTGQGIKRSLRDKGNQIGAKTGTTNNSSDGWFIGVTKDLVAGAWCGGDNRSVHFRSWYMGQGARTAMPIWVKFMEKVYEDEELEYEKGPFPKPIRKLSVEINCNAYDNPYYNDADSTASQINDDSDSDGDLDWF